MNSILQTIGKAISDDFKGFFSAEELTHIVLRLGAACLAGAIVGYQREKLGKSAGLRTHILVTAGSALFVTVCYLEEMDHSDVSRVLQGVITGIGFLGGGVILKIEKDHEIKGLTSAAAIWYVAALGIACGLGKFTLAIVGAIAGFLILELVTLLEKSHQENA